MDWSLLHTLNDFLASHDGLEDSLLFYVEASEALFIATLAVVFLCGHGVKHLAWRRATVAAVLSAGLGLAIAKVISELVGRARPFVAPPRRSSLRRSPAGPPAFPATTRPRPSRSPSRSCCESVAGESSPWLRPRCSRSAGSPSAFTSQPTFLAAPP